MDNKNLENLLDEMKESNQHDNREEFLAAIQTTMLLVPAVMPDDTPQEVLEEMMANPGKNKQLPEGANPQPCVFENGEGERFLPVFTSDEHMRAGENSPAFPLTLNIPFDACIGLVQENQRVDGLVINPYTHNIVFQLNEEQEADEEEYVQQEVTIEQFHMLMRQKFEAFLFPKTLFEQKGEFAKKVSMEKGAAVKELYYDVYDTEIACPYTEDEFDFMSLNITEDLLLVQVTMPAQNNYPGTCTSVIYAWDSKEDKVWYFGFVRGNQGAPNEMIQIQSDGTPVHHGEAPSEGSELQSVLDIIQA